MHCGFLFPKKQFTGFILGRILVKTVFYDNQKPDCREIR